MTSRPWLDRCLRLDRRREAAFTLIEVLVAVALLALIAGALMATFSGGIRVWERMEHHDAQARWVVVAFEQFRRDLHNIRRFEPVGFSGTYDAVAFPTLVESPLTTGHIIHELGERRYAFERMRHRLCRSDGPYRLSSQRDLADRCQTLLEDVSKLRFSYYAFDPTEDAYTWSDHWSAAEPPLAVKLELTYRAASTQQPVEVSTVVQIPAAAVR